MIRRATADDVEEIVAIFEPSLALLDFLPRHTHEEILGFFASRIRESEAYILRRGFAILDGDWLTHLYVRPDEIGTGLGHAMFERVTTLRPDGFASTRRTAQSRSSSRTARGTRSRCPT
jgi:GNAT superfamily N-acetyltransferase